MLGTRTYAANMQYAAGRGLTYPLTSSVFREGLRASKIRAASGPLWALDFAIFQALTAELRTLAEGECR